MTTGAAARLTAWNSAEMIPEMIDPTETTVIPETNLSADRGEMLAETVLYPASVRSESLSSVEASDPIPEDGEFYLFPNYPNPFNSRTNIVFDVPYRSRIHLEILDSRGRPIRTLKQGLVRAGRYTIPWDGKDEQGHPMPSGQYVSKLSSPFFTQIQKVMLVQ